MNIRTWSFTIVAAALAAAPLLAATSPQTAPPAPAQAGHHSGDSGLDDGAIAAGLEGDAAGIDDNAEAPPADEGGGAPGMHRGAGRHGGGGGFEARGERLAALDLTDDQRAKMRDIATDLRRKTIPARADIQLAQLDLREMLREDKPDMRKVESQIDKIAGMRADMAKLAVGARVEMRSMLTPEQRRKLEEMPRGMGRGEGMRRWSGSR